MRYGWLIFVWAASHTLLLGSGFSSLPSLYFSRSVATYRGLDQTCFGGVPQFARATLPAQTRPRRIVPRVSMDTEGDAFSGDDMLTTQIIKVSTTSGWEEVQRVARENGMFILAEFRQEFCRKCMAIAPKFKKLPTLFAGREIMFVEVDAMKIGKPARIEMAIKVVPTFRFYQDGEMLDEFVAKRDLTETMVAVVEMVNRLAPSEYSEDNRDVVTKLKEEFGVSGVRATNTLRTRREHAAPGTAETKVDGDAFAAWRRAQSQRASGTSTLLRGVNGSSSPRAPEAAPGQGQGQGQGQKPNNYGGMSAQELLDKLEKSQNAEKKKPEASSPPPAKSGGAQGGGDSAEDLLAQLKRLEDKGK